jgi:hypothetical protein
LICSACRARALKAPGVYSALAGGAAQRENTGARFRDVPGVFARHGAKCAPQWVALRKERGSRMWKDMVMKE